MKSTIVLVVLTRARGCLKTDLGPIPVAPTGPVHGRGDVDISLRGFQILIASQSLSECSVDEWHVTLSAVKTCLLSNDGRHANSFAK